MGFICSGLKFSVSLIFSSSLFLFEESTGVEKGSTNVLVGTVVSMALVEMTSC